LSDFISVKIDFGKVGLNLRDKIKPFLLGHQHHRHINFMDHFGKIIFLNKKRHFVAFQLLKIQNVINQTVQPIGAYLHNGQ